MSTELPSTDPKSTDTTDSTTPAETTGGAHVVDLPGADGTTRLSLPNDASETEATAIAAAVAAHLAAEETAADADESQPVDRWKLAERLGPRQPARVPTNCSPADAWKLAGRCRSW
jgi:hypothetical protein